VVKDKLTKLTKNLLKLRINYLIKPAFILAETTYKVGNGAVKLDYATNHVASKALLLNCFKPMLKDIMGEQFSNNEQFINNMIIRERILI